MTNREMAIRHAAATIEQMLKFNNANAQSALEVLKAEIEVFDLIQDLMREK
jgi:hypothetical protein